MRFFFQILFILVFFGFESYGFYEPSKNIKTEDKSVLKADAIEGDRDTNTVTAIGNVEITNGSIIANADKATYDKNNGLININGNLTIKELETGKLFAKEGQVKDDFSKGHFLEGTIVFNDGSYLESERIERESPFVTKLIRPIFSICPNDKIVGDNKLAGKLWDAISIKSSSTKIDREKNTIRSKHGIIRIYEVPILYTPFLQLPLKETKRKTGFLTPSYVNNSQFGLGINVPYFIDAAPNIDLVVAPKLYKDSDQFIINNEIHHIVKYGDYRMNFEFANNKVTSERDLTEINRSKKNYRYYLQGEGNFVFTKNSSVDYKIKSVGDHNYLRDYAFDFSAYTLSEVNYDYTKNRDYLGIKALRIQELEFQDIRERAPIVMPAITYYTESNNSIFYKEKYAITSNLTAINREDGLQYKRLSLIPEVKIPLNIYGNLFDINSKVELDYYWLENNFKYRQNYTQYDQSQTNYKPEFSARWRLPLIKKLESTTIMFEPTANFVSSSVHKKFNKLPNEDSNDAELSVNNLFIADRIAGFDRNEAGERISYGARSSLYNEYGQFELDLGQSYRISEEVQDVVIRGFNANNKSNIVGQAFYTAKKYFDTNYIFQLNESNYRNDVNSWNVNFHYDRFTLSNSYLLIRKGALTVDRIEQDNITAGWRLTPRFSVKGSLTRNMVTKENLTRAVELYYDGCCTEIKFTASENNSSNLTKTQRSYSVNITVKNL